MANFTWEIKRELLSPPENACCKVAECAAYLRTSGSITSSYQGFGFEIVSENERIAEYFINLFESVYGIRFVLKDATVDPKRERDKLTFAYDGERASQVLQETGVLRRDEGGFAINFGLSPYLVENDCCALSYVKGAFLGGGSCTIPSGSGKTGYHLEFVFSSYVIAEEFCSLLASFELLARMVKRGDKTVVYLKSRDELSDFFSLIGAHGALKRLNSVSEAREENNKENRVNNCIVGNMDRTAQASAEQAIAISAIKDRVGLDCLEASLRQLAEARIEFPMESLRQLAERLGVSKSCLNHRMRKLMEIYHDLDETL
ncbi:MAG: DNA-binding protein WhiA [Clostridia bacterium]|nr:DNA-binding protein WhiA [Clostridia bacterium]